MAQTPAGKVFISYSHKDKAYLDRLQEFLIPSVREGIIPLWVDTQIKPGDDWHEKIKAALADAQVAILLVSVSFLASTFVAEEELPRLLTSAGERGLVVLPVVVTPCLFKRTNLSRFQAVNDPSKPLSGLSQYDQDLIWERVVESVLDALERQKQLRPDPTPQPVPPRPGTASQQLAKSKVHWVQEGEHHRAAGRLLEALDCYEQALLLDPTDAETWNSKGLILSDNLKRHGEALAAHERALELDPKLAYAWYNKGNDLSRLQRYPEALAAYERALELDPKLAYAWYNQGIALFNLQHYEGSLAAFEQALKLDPNFAIAWGNKGTVFLTLKRYEEALEAYERSLQLNPSNVNDWKNKAIALDQLGRTAEAAQARTRARELG